MYRKKKESKASKSAEDNAESESSNAEMIYSPKVAKKKVDSLFEYFFIMELDKKDEANNNENDEKGNNVNFLYRYPEKEVPGISLKSIDDVVLFSFPSYFHFKKQWESPIVFHFNISLENIRIYGSSLIFYRKLQSLTTIKMVYEPIALTLLSQLPFLDQFSAILKHLYMTFCHAASLNDTAGAPLGPPPPLLAATVSFLRSLPVPNSFRNVTLVLRPSPPFSAEKEAKSPFSAEKEAKSPFSAEKEAKTFFFSGDIKTASAGRRVSHPVVEVGQHGVRVDALGTRPSHRYLVRPPPPRASSQTDLPSLGRRAKSCGGRALLAEAIWEKEGPVTQGSARAISNEGLALTVALELGGAFFALPPLAVNLYQNIFNVLDLQAVVNVMACVMCEVSTVFVSSQFSLLAKVQEGFKALLFPFVWNHIHVPNLPKQLLHLIEAPVPFMIGINNKYFELVKEKGIKNKVLFIFVDTSSIYYFNRVPNFPSKKKNYLINATRKILKPELFEADSIFKHMHDKYSDSLQNKIRKVFLKFMQNLMDGYRKHVRFPAGESPKFFEDAYLSELDDRSNFYKKFFKTHMFSVFIERHKSHPGLLIDYVEYICNSPSVDDGNVENITFKIPGDLDKAINKADYEKTGRVYAKDPLLEKSALEMKKGTSKNRITIVLKDIFLNEKSCSSEELTSISELLKILYWRKFLLAEIIEWIKNPTNKMDYKLSSKEVEKIMWLKNLSKISLNAECFENLSFLLFAVLSECQVSRSTADYRIAKTALDASTLFYKNEVVKGKEKQNFIINCLLSHEILKRKKFWMSILAYEIEIKFDGKAIDSDWCFKRIIRYCHQIVDLNIIPIDEVNKCIDFWCDFCKLNEENKRTLKEAAKNLEASKNVRIAEYLNGGDFSDFEFVEKFKAVNRDLIATPKLAKEISMSVKSEIENKKSIDRSRTKSAE